MKLATFAHEGERAVGAVVDGRLLALSRLGARLGAFPESMLALIAAGPDAWQAVREALAEAAGAEAERGIPLADVELLAPIPRPPKNVMCLGLNYAAHAAESAGDREVRLPQAPIVFTKAPTSINGPYADVVCDPAVTEELDWEVELAVVIGRPGRAIAVDAAPDHVFGYMVLNDVTARDLQRRHRQYFLGKSLDGACPTGPWIVTADEIPDPQALSLRSRVNGVVKQAASTADMIFDVATTISILSQGTTLEAGDIIATGTPEGVGFARTPPEFLQPGDLVECEIEGIGAIRNPIVGPT